MSEISILKTHIKMNHTCQSQLKLVEFLYQERPISVITNEYDTYSELSGQGKITMNAKAQVIWDSPVLGEKMAFKLPKQKGNKNEDLKILYSHFDLCLKSWQLPTLEEFKESRRRKIGATKKFKDSTHKADVMFWQIWDTESEMDYKQIIQFIQS